jgi:hypothetical protein
LTEAELVVDVVLVEVDVVEVVDGVAEGSLEQNQTGQYSEKA